MFIFPFVIFDLQFVLLFGFGVVSLSQGGKMKNKSKTWLIFLILGILMIALGFYILFRGLKTPDVPYEVDQLVGGVSRRMNMLLLAWLLLPIGFVLVIGSVISRFIKRPNAEKPSSAPIIENNEPIQNEEPKSNDIYCQYCGSKIKEGDVSCSSCGAKLRK